MRNFKINPHSRWEVLLERHMKIRAMSPKSISTYILGLRKFHGFFKYPLEEATAKDIERYQYELVNASNYNYNTYCSAVASLRYYFMQVAQKDWTIDTIPRPRTIKKIPIALSEWEVSRLLFFTDNIRSRLTFKVIYATGMRINEMLNLKVEHIDGQRERLRIVDGKGRKDRELPLWPELRESLRDLYKLRSRKSSPYLLNNKYGDEASDDSVLRRHLKVALSKANIKKNVSLHTLRHSFATHHLQHGLCIKDLQGFLGHSDIRHTMLYLHLTEDSYGKSECILKNLPKLDKNGDLV